MADSRARQQPAVTVIGFSGDHRSDGA